MSREISLRIAWGLEQALEASKRLYEYEMMHSAKRYIGWFFVALLQFGIVLLLHRGQIWLLLFSSLAVLYWYFGRWHLRSFFLRRYYQKQNLYPRTITLKCSDAHLILESKQLSWEAIEYAIDIKGAIVLQIEGKLLYIPYGAFSCVEDIDYCLLLLKEHHKLRR